MDEVVVGKGVILIDVVVDGSDVDGDAVVDFVDVVVGNNDVVFIDEIDSGVVSLDDVVVESVDVVDGDGVGVSINVVVIGSDVVVVVIVCVDTLVVGFVVDAAVVSVLVVLRDGVDVPFCSDVEADNVELVAESVFNTSAIVVVIFD